MCLCFKKKVPSPAPAALTLPHPEEPADPDATLSIDAVAVFLKWLRDWGVPEEHHPYWCRYEIQVTENLLYEWAVAECYSDINLIKIRPRYVNPGTFAHECAHESYSLLSEAEKSAFKDDYDVLIQSDKLLQLLYSLKASCMYNYGEVHAELYRYLGDQMPDSLKKFYPKLF